MQKVRAKQKYKNLIPGVLYHIIQRAPGRELLFLEDSDYLKFMALLKETCSEFSFDILAFCLMPNHLHLLGNSTKNNFSQAMQYLFKNYADYFNKKYSRKGHVFHGVFRVVPCLNEPYLVTVSVYIHLNPYKANLCPSPEKWKWSSLSLYYYPHKESFINQHKILELFSSNDKEAVKQYKEIIKSSTKYHYVNILENKNAIKMFFSDAYKYFADTMKKNIFRKEYEIERLLKKGRLEQMRSIDARTYAMEQLLSRGYDIEFICQYLKISRSHAYRIMKRQR